MSDLTFHTPPERQGQTIETSFATDGERILRLTFDRSDQNARIAETPFEELGEAPFEPWNEEPPFADDTVWTPCEVVSDGEQWCIADDDGYLHPLGFALLDASPYGALQRPDKSSAFMRLANDNWADGLHDCGAELAWHAFDYPAHRARWERQELCCDGDQLMRVEALEHDSCGRCGAVGPHYSMHTGDGECLCSSCIDAEGTEGERSLPPGPKPFAVRFRGHCVGALESTPTLTSGYPTVRWGALQKFTRSLWPVGHIFEHDGRRWRVERNTYSQGDEYFPDVYTFEAVPLGPELPFDAAPGVLEALASEIPLTGPTRESERKVLAAMARRDRG